MVFRWAIAFACLAPAALAQTPCNNTPAYSLCEMTFDLPGNAHPIPYASVDLRVEFRSPRRRTYAMPAFWDGGRRMVVRFSPTESGAWDYHVSSNVAEWNDKTGSFTAAASESPGFIQPANVHHWMYNEKSAAGLYQPHLWMGSTDLLFAAMDDAAFRALAERAPRRNSRISAASFSPVRSATNSRTASRMSISSGAWTGTSGT